MMKTPFILENERKMLNFQVHAMRFAFLRRKRIITNEVIHPSVLEIQKNNSSFFIMALTPYPSMDARWENPSVVFSDDGIQWNEGKVVNPIFPPPKNAVSAGGPHNCDTNLVWNPVEMKASIFFINWGEGSSFIRSMSSRDFVNWRDDGVSNINTIIKGNEIRVSPSILYSNALSEYLMFVVRADFKMNKKSYVELFKSKDRLIWSKVGDAINVVANYRKEYFYPWHISVRTVGNEYWMMTAMNHGKLSYPPMYLFFFSSCDGLQWTSFGNPLLLTSLNGFDNGKIYHSDFIVKNGVINVWYSAMSSDNEFRIGRLIGSVYNKLLISDNYVDCREI